MEKKPHHIKSAKLLLRPKQWGNGPWFKRKQTESFFERVARRLPYMNKEIVEEVYREIIRVTVADLRKDKWAIFPDFCRMKVMIARGGQIPNPNGPGVVRVPPRYRLFIKPERKIQAYFKAFDPNKEDLTFKTDKI